MTRWQDKLGQQAYVLSFTGNKRRRPALEQELSRVGISAELIYGFPTPFPNFIINQAEIPHTPDINMPSYAGIWFSHYRVIKTGYELGYDRILVMEDDIRFMRDLNKIADRMKDFPEHADLVLLDSAIPKRKHRAKLVEDQGNANWIKSDGRITLWSAACFSLSRNGMRACIYLFESVLDQTLKGRMMRNADQWWNSTLLDCGANEIWFARENLALQLPDKDIEHGFYEDNIARMYQKCGLRLEDYGS